MRLGQGSPCQAGRTKYGAGEGNRTLVFSLGSCCSTIELHPHFAGQPATATRSARSGTTFPVGQLAWSQLPMASCPFRNMAIGHAVISNTELPARSNVLRRPFGLLVAFLGLPVRDMIGLVLAWVLLACAAVALRLVPFRRLAPLLGKALGPAASIPVIDARQAERARLIRRSVLRAARVAPFRSDCLPQSLAGAVLCRVLRVPATVFLGVRLDDVPSGMAAHAWLCAGPVAVTGGQSFDRFTVVAAFALPGSRSVQAGC